MKYFLVMALIGLGLSACKQEDTATQMAKDVCACIMPVVDEGEKANEILRRGNEAEIAALEEAMLQSQKNTTECFQNLEKKYGNMEDYKDQVTDKMQTLCPKAAALLSGAGQ